MDADQVQNICFGLVVVWGAVTLLHALWMARDPKWEPAPPEEPEHHEH
jgi:hypothetical protein